MKYYKAIAAMCGNRVIGAGGRVPWHLPEELKWFKRMTTGNVVVMGRKTFESLGGRLLLNRLNVVVTRDPGRYREKYGEGRGGTVGALSGGPVAGGDASAVWDGGTTELRWVPELFRVRPDDFGCDVFVIGGAELYRLSLPYCWELILSRVKRDVEGDTYFPVFEEGYRLDATLWEGPEFSVERWLNLAPLPLPG